MQLVEVTWEDTYHDGESGWQSTEQWVKSLEVPFIVKTVGYQVYECSTHWIIAASLDSNGMVSDCTRIPSGMVRDVVVLSGREDA